MTVGKSQVTPFKHMLINSIVGREAGVFSLNKQSLGWLKPPYIFIDANAGDGADDMSTPKTLLKHAETIRQKRGNEAAEVILIEKDNGTFEKLTGNIDSKDAFALCGCSSDLVPEILLDAKLHPVFLVIDPNHIEGLPDMPAITSRLNRATSMLVTMGVNVGGLKRLPLSRREKWYDQVYSIINSMNKSTHKLLLIRMLKGKGQWSYLIMTPRAWAERVRDDVASAAKKAAKKAKSSAGDLFGCSPDVGAFEYECAIYGEQRFKEMLDILFLTGKERGAA